MKQENWLVGQKNYHQEEKKKRKENFVNIKDIEISCGCSLQY